MRETSDDAEPYHVGGFQFAPNCGVYFLVAGSYDLLPLLEQLSYSGIGGKRSSGYGRFEFSVSDNSLFPLMAPHQFWKACDADDQFASSRE